MPRALRSVEGVYFTKYTVKIDESQLSTLTEDDFIDMFTKAAADFYEKKGGGDHPARHA